MARNKYPEETRNLIIETSAKLFTEKGYDHTSIQDIINHLGGLSKGAIYHHFKSKEDILWAVADTIYLDTEKQLYDIRNRNDLNGKEKIQALFHTSLGSSDQVDMWKLNLNMLKMPQLLVLQLCWVLYQDVPSFPWR